MTTLVESTHFSLVHDSNCACLYATWQGHHDGPSTQTYYGVDSAVHAAYQQHEAAQ